MPPTLLLVHGLPASGKTTLAKQLARDLGWPAVYKDEIKEILFDTLGWSDRARSRVLGVATIEVLYYIVNMQLSAGASVLAECNFKPELASPTFREMTERNGAGVIQVLCRADGAARLRRFRARARHPGHADVEIGETEADIAAWRAEDLAPLDLPGPLITVDTTDPATVDVQQVLRQVRAGLRQST